MMIQMSIGFVTGLFIGIAVFSHPTSRAVVTGVIAGVIIGAIVVDGVDGYVRWATYLPAELARLSAFWLSTIAGIVVGAHFWPPRHII
jgi:hypothetical protein